MPSNPKGGSAAPRLDHAYKTALTLLLAGVGLTLARHFRLPGGMIIGAMAATAVASLLDMPVAALPHWMRQGARTLLGLTIGTAVTAETLRTVSSALLPVITIILAMTAAGLAVAWAINRVTGMSLPTALCGSAPGVLSAMVALADELGGDGPVVASLHLVRLISLLLFVPTVAYAFFDPVSTPLPTAVTATVGPGFLPLAILLVVGLLGGHLAGQAGIPAGDLLAGLVIAAIFNALWLDMGAAPDAWRIGAQWIVGAGIGAAVTRKTLRTFRPFAMAGALMTALFLAIGLLLAWLLYQMTTLDLVTCLVASAAGGADQMIILAGELGGDVQLVAAVHVARQIILLLVVPFLVRAAMRRSATALVEE